MCYHPERDKLTSFTWDGQDRPVEFVETMPVREGVVCDVYSFPHDSDRDLGIVTVRKGCRTPRQRVVQGSRTIEGFMGGAGVLTITYPDETQRAYVYPHEDTPAEVVVAIGQIMQWQATDADLTFYEICEPPYQPGRYTDLPAAEE